MNNSCKKVEATICAKVNLSLQIIGSREDGYHNLDMLSTSINLHNKISYEESSENIVTFNSNDLGMQSNAARALLFLQNQYKLPKAKVSIVSNIPRGAGLGGSSADAAGIIRIIEHLYKVDITSFKDEFVKIGSDIQFMLQGGCARVFGRGEIVNSLDLKLPNFLLYTPDYPLSTSQIFSQYKKGYKSIANTEGLIKEISNNKRELKYLKNDLLQVVLDQNAQFKKDYMTIKSIVENTVMTGSGSGIVSLIYDDKESLLAQKELSDRGYKTLYVSPTKNGFTLL